MIGRTELGRLLDQVLPGVSPDTIRELVGASKTRWIQRDDLLFRQGEPIPLILIAEGYGAFRRTTLDGRQFMVGIGNPGELFGISNTSELIASVDFVALTDGAVATWPDGLLRQLVMNDPALALLIIKYMGDRVNMITEKVDGFLHQDARVRVIRVLARHRDLFFNEPAVLSRSELPALVGTSREMTGRVLRDLEHDGLVARVGRTGLTLLDPERFNQQAAGLK